MRYTRRELLKFTGAAMVTGVAQPALALAPEKKIIKDKTLKFYNTHTGETLRTTFFTKEGLIDSEMALINNIMRDHRAEEVSEMDPVLLLQLHKLQETLGHDGTVEIISGYRSPNTNAMLRKKSNGGVAKKSYHMQGMALDVRMPGTDTRNIQKAAIKMAFGGVGYYGGSDFVHIDTGRVRTW